MKGLVKFIWKMFCVFAEDLLVANGSGHCQCASFASGLDCAMPIRPSANVRKPRKYWQFPEAALTAAAAAAWCGSSRGCGLHPSPKPRTIHLCLLLLLHASGCPSGGLNHILFADGVGSTPLGCVVGACFKASVRGGGCLLLCSPTGFRRVAW